MTYWIGPYDIIVAAEAAATAIITARPESRDGAELPHDLWITARWAEPCETASPGVWAIPALDGMELPAGVTTVETPEWPEVTWNV